MRIGHRIAPVMLTAKHAIGKPTRIDTLQECNIMSKLALRRRGVGRLRAYYNGETPIKLRTSARDQTRSLSVTEIREQSIENIQ
jgi:hypothetical protein